MTLSTQDGLIFRHSFFNSIYPNVIRFASFLLIDTYEPLLGQYQYTREWPCMSSEYRFYWVDGHALFQYDPNFCALCCLRFIRLIQYLENINRAKRNSLKGLL